MFVVLTVTDGTCYFELPEIDKYQLVAVVEIQQLPENNKPIEEHDETIDDDDEEIYDD